MRTLAHIGIPTTTPKSGEMYNEGMKLFLTDPAADANRIEWLRFDADSWMPQLIQTQAHVAYGVSDPEAEMNGKNVLLPATHCGGDMWIAFIEEDGVAVELIWHK